MYRQQRALRLSCLNSLISDTLIPLVRDQTTDTTKSVISTFQKPPGVCVSTRERNSGLWATLWQILCIIQQPQSRTNHIETVILESGGSAQTFDS